MSVPKMQFKKPRDPAHVPDCQPIRKFQPLDGFICEVGRGECGEPAIEEQDGGGAGTIKLCAQHAKEFKELNTLFSEMTPDQFKNAEQVIMEEVSKTP